MGTKSMPETITLDDGTTREVLTEQEQNDLQAGHDANIAKRDTVKEYEDFKESLDLAEGQTATEKLQEMKDSVNPNFAGMRAKNKALIAAAKDKGINVDNDGNIVEENKSLTAEETKAITNQTFDERQAEANKIETLKDYSAKEAEAIGKVFDKLATLGGTFKENMGLAIQTVLPGTTDNFVKRVNSLPGGGGPRQAVQGEATEELKSFGSKFGLKADDFKNK